MRENAQFSYYENHVNVTQFCYTRNINSNGWDFALQFVHVITSFM